MKEESEKVGLKLNIQKTNLMVSGPITSWQIDGETVADFIFGGSKITADGGCSHEIKRFLLLRKESYDQPAAAKSLQLCPTLCDPIDGCPPGFPSLDPPGKNTGVGKRESIDCLFFSDWF